MVQALPVGYVVDPEDPRAPPMAEWRRMSAGERARVMEELPSEGTFDFLPPPEGDDHWEATTITRLTLPRMLQVRSLCVKGFSGVRRCTVVAAFTRNGTGLVMVLRGLEMSSLKSPVTRKGRSGNCVTNVCAR